MCTRALECPLAPVCITAACPSVSIFYSIRYTVITQYRYQENIAVEFFRSYRPALYQHVACYSFSNCLHFWKTIINDPNALS